MKLHTIAERDFSELERDVLHFGLNYAYRYLTERIEEYKRQGKTEYVEYAELQLEAVKTSVEKLLKPMYDTRIEY